jgi:hypothetical protein
MQCIEHYDKQNLLCSPDEQLLFGLEISQAMY